MRVYARKIEFGDLFTLIPIGDTHLGAKACDKKRIKATIDWVLNRPDTYVIGMGDYMDAISRTDPRFDPDEIEPVLLKNLDNLVPLQRDMVVDMFMPLAEEGRLLGMLTGNHERKVKKHYSVDVMNEITKELDVPYLGYSCFYRLTLKNRRKTRNVVIYAHHGYGGGRKPGASINKLVDVVSNYEADIVLQGHDHEKIGKRHKRLSITDRGKPRLVSNSLILGRTGTFLKTAQQDTESYSEIAGYPPTDLGVLRIDIRFQGEHHELDMHVSE